jgi:hypothetical protein
MRGNIGNAFVSVAVNQTTDSVCHLIANIVSGNLDIEVLSDTHLICSKVLDDINHSTVARYMNVGLQMLWPSRVH